MKKTALFLAVLVCTATATASAQPGVAQLPGKSGCIAVANSRCATLAVLNGVSDIAISDDGRSIYAVTDTSDALVVLKRAATSGRLSAGECYSARGGCTAQDGLKDAAGVATVGDDVYVAAEGAGRVLHFRRAGAGAVSYVDCVGATADTGCAAIDPLLVDPAEVRVAASGRALIVTRHGGNIYADEHRDHGSVVSLARDPGSGTLRSAGCLVVKGQPGCPGGDVLLGDPRDSVAVARKGRLVYVSASDGVTVARIGTDGGLQRVGCLNVKGTLGCRRTTLLGTGGDFGPSLSLTADGRTLTRAGLPSYDLGHEAFVSFAVNPASGALGRYTCISLSASGRRDDARDTRPRTPGCRAGRPPLDDVREIAISPDGRRLVTADRAYDLLSVVTRSASGTYSRVLTKRGCVGDDAAYSSTSFPGGHESCARGAGFHGMGTLLWSPDSRFVYAAQERGIVVVRVT